MFQLGTNIFHSNRDFNVAIYAEGMVKKQAAEISGTHVLILDRRDDAHVCNASSLAATLRSGGAEVEFRTLSAGHELAGAVVAEAAEWIGRNLSGPASREASGPSAE